MRLGILGELRVDDSVDEWLVSEAVPVPYFDGMKLRFILDGIVAGDSAPQDFEEAAAAFLALNLGNRQAATPYVEGHYRKFRDVSVKHGWEVRPHEFSDIWEHVHPSEVVLSRRDRDRRIYVEVSAECDWDGEHGLLLVFRDGKVLSRVSSQDGHPTHADAYGLPDSEDR